MNPEKLLATLGRFCPILRAVTDNVSSADARWRPADGAWSILEVVRHLGDEEVEDFRTRIRLTLAGKNEPWPPIDPPTWAVERGYNDGDLSEAVAHFATERRISLDWLDSLDCPDWSKSYQHPKLGPLRAGDLLVSWTAHDALHLRQIAKRTYQMTQRDGGGYNTAYAGSWTA